MTGPKLEQIWEEILGFYPFYDTDGCNSTLVLLQDGRQYTDRRKTKTLLQDMAKIFAADLSALRHNYRDFLGRKGLVPLPLHKNLILFPFRVRRVEYKDHGATGYAVFSKIKAVAPIGEDSSTGPMSRITMSGGVTLNCMEKPATVNKRLAEAGQVQKEYCRFYAGNILFPAQEYMRDPFSIGGEGQIVYHIHYHAGVRPG